MAFNLFKAISIIKQLDAIISIRLHGNILAYILNKPFLALSYDKKIDNFMQDINNDNIIDLKNFNKEGFFEKLNNFLYKSKFENEFQNKIKKLYKEILEVW